jgi:hypothetical protein
MRDRWILKVKLKEALSKIDSIPAFENAAYLRAFAYPDTGILRHPFSDNQVTDMRKTYVEADMLKSITGNLETNVIKLVRQGNLKDSIIVNQEVQIRQYVGLNQGCMDLVQMKEAVITEQKKDIKREKRLKSLFQGISVVETLLILISLI